MYKIIVRLERKNTPIIHECEEYDLSKNRLSFDTKNSKVSYNMYHVSMYEIVKIDNDKK